MNLTTILEQLAAGRRLSSAEAAAAFELLMDGAATEVETAAFLTALRVRGETAEEMAAAARTLRRRLTPPDRPGLLDTCGVGGDGAATFNISTAAALVVAGCGLIVAKHGNRAVSSTSGSADVLSVLGVQVEAEPAVVLECLDHVGLAFFFAPAWHASMKHVGPVRRQLRFRTIFNLIGPLANPAGADYQLIGVGREETADRLAAALLLLNDEAPGGRARAAAVVVGGDGLDEVTLAAPTSVRVVRGGAIEQHEWTPDDFGLPTYSTHAWRVESPTESAERIRGVLAGRPGPDRDIVLANTAAALWIAGRVVDLREGVATAAASLDDGAAAAKLAALVDRSRRPAGVLGSEVS
ncbi:MAG: anthranilate phosphoribosyltransferase [Planctomycetia bacterium]